MKKLILSLAALAFATFLFSQEDTNDTPEASQDSVVIMKDGFQNNSELPF